MVSLRLADESFFPSLVEWANAHDEDFVKLWAGRAYQYPLSVEQLKDVYKDGINSVRSGVFIYWKLSGDHRALEVGGGW